MVIHEACTQQNDTATNQPIQGKTTLNKVNPGTWTRTIITEGDVECKSGKVRAFGPGGSGDGVLIKKMKTANGGTSPQLEQTVLVFMGPKGV